LILGVAFWGKLSDEDREGEEGKEVVRCGAVEKPKEIHEYINIERHK